MRQYRIAIIVLPVCACRDVLNHPNIAFDLRIPGGSAISSALNVMATAVLLNQNTTEVAMGLAAAKIDAAVAAAGGAAFLNSTYLVSIYRTYNLL